MEVAKHIGYLIDNNATMLEATDYLRDFVRQQCDVTKEITQGVADKALAAEREKARGLVDKAHKLAMAAETYLAERPVYTGKPIGAEGSPARIEQQRQADAAAELVPAYNAVYKLVDTYRANGEV